MDSPPSVRRGRLERPRRVDGALLMTGVMAVAATGLLERHLGRPALTSDHSVPWWVLVAAFLAAETCMVHLRLRRESHSVTLNEIPLVLALVFTSPVVLLLTRASSTVIAYALVLRQRGVKLAWNLSRLALETGLALTVHRAVLGDAHATSPRGWVAAYAAMVSVDVVAGLAVTTVLVLRSGRQEWRGTNGVLLVGVAAAAVTTSLALVGALILEQEPLAVLLLGVVALALLLAYRSHTALSAGVTSLRVLHEFTKSVSRSVREQDVVDTTLEEARSLLRAEVAELVLPVGDGFLRLSTDDAGSSRSRLDGPQLPLWLQPAMDGQVVRFARPRLGDGTAWRVTGHKDLLAVPLQVEGAAVGVLLVADRVDGVSTFADEDERLLETLAGSAAVALRNGRLVEQLLEEAAQEEHRALHDALTGLPNRQAVVRRLEAALHDDGCDVAVLHVTLGGIAQMRADISHEAGDAVLAAATAALADALPEDWLLARVSGDDLVAVAPAADAAASSAHAERVLGCLAVPVAAAGLLVPLSPTVGVALAADGVDADALLLRAQAAGHLADKAGQALHLHPVGSDDHGRRRLGLALDLSEALHRGEVEVFYQPKVCLRTGAAVGVEALARWRHPQHGPVPPTEFVPVAESAGLVWRLTLHVLDTALGQCAAWRAEGRTLTVAVNLSMRSLHELSLRDDVRHLLERHGLPASCLVLEITEGSMMTRPEATLAVLGQLRGLGVGLAIDDFGTGWSSLAHLAHMPVTELKIDKAFVLDVATSEQNAAIVRSTVALAHDLGLHVVAEGIEDASSWEFLADLGCELGQGYFMSRPLPADALAAWLDRQPVIPLQAGPPAAELSPGARAASPTGHRPT